MARTSKAPLKLTGARRKPKRTLPPGRPQPAPARRRQARRPKASDDPPSQGLAAGPFPSPSSRFYFGVVGVQDSCAPCPHDPLISTLSCLSLAVVVVNH